MAGDLIIPGAYSEVTTVSSGVSVPANVRTVTIMGEGARNEVIVTSALGFGNDGLDPTCTSVNGRDGRHFRLNNAPVISNRTTIFKNGIPLVGLEAPLNSNPFSSKYDYRLDISGGCFELQRAALVDLGGSYFLPNSQNTGDGTISGLALTDPNAPTESWSIRCVSIRRDGYGNPVSGFAKFIAQGTVSGILLDGYGNQVFWESNGVSTTNGILSFSIIEGATPFVEGDRFSVKVKSGVLSPGDSLTATYIAVTDLNDPDFFLTMDEVVAKHGLPSLQNRLSLGAQLAFANNPPGIWCLQTYPAVPRRLDYSLVTSATGDNTLDDLSFPLPLNVNPDPDSNINFFVTDDVTGVETQIMPNKVPFYDPTITSNPSGFVFGPATYSYTVIMAESLQKSGIDGVIVNTGPTTGTLSSASVLFNLEDLNPGRNVVIYGAVNADNDGTFTVASVTNGVVTLNNPSGFVNETDIKFRVFDTDETSAQILFTDDLALAVGQSLRTTLVDEKDADFFDVGWINAYEALEKIETSIVVPLPSQTISQIFLNGKNHCEVMSNIKNRKERVLFIGAIKGLSVENVLGTEDAAVEDLGILEGIQGDEVTEILAGNDEDIANYGVQNSYSNSFRVVYFYPDEIVVQLGADRVLVDGFFIAAAAGGYLTGVPNVAMPLTRKSLSGFTILRDKLFRPAILEMLISAGITVLQPVAGGGIVIKGQTTTNSGYVEEQEISIIFIRDAIAKMMRAGYEGFVGGVDGKGLQGNLISRGYGILNGAINSGLITDFRALKAERDLSDPTQWNITVAVQPVYPVNYIRIKISVGLL